MSDEDLRRMGPRATEHANAAAAYLANRGYVPDPAGGTAMVWAGPKEDYAAQEEKRN
jgi:hypothetical protein